jgi:hypothetical protein
LRHYRIELPNMIDDLGLSVYAFRLYVHLKRVAEDEGSCWQSARTLAEACNMSAGKVSEAKDELEQKHLITRHPKIQRGGIGDDITIVDIWPQNFARYAPESEPRKESDHHTITSSPEVITTRSLRESDHHTITSDESDQEVIALTSKRSPHDPKNHDQYHIGVITNTPPPTPTRAESKNGGGGGEDSQTYQFLIDEGIGAAAEFADIPYDVMRADYDARRKDNQTKAAIVRAWRTKRPTLRARTVAQPLTATRANLPETTVAPAEVLRQLRERR